MFFIFVGTAGCRIGLSLFSFATAEIAPSFYDLLKRPKAIFVETDNRIFDSSNPPNGSIVISSDCVLSPVEWQPEQDRMFSGEFQLFGKNQKVFRKIPVQSIGAAVLQNLQSRLEVTDPYEGLVIVHSASGAIGGSFTSGLLKRIRKTIIPLPGLISTCTVLGSEHTLGAIGQIREVISLSLVYSQVDSILLFENQKVMTLLGDGGAQSRASVSLQEVNRYYAYTILLLYSQRNALFDQITAVVPMPTMKIACGLTFAPHLFSGGQKRELRNPMIISLVNGLRATYESHHGRSKRPRTHAAQVVIGGLSVTEFESSLSEVRNIATKFLQMDTKVQLDIKRGTTKVAGPWCCVCYCHADLANSISFLCSRAQKIVESGAFSHHYSPNLGMPKLVERAVSGLSRVVDQLQME